MLMSVGFVATLHLAVNDIALTVPMTGPAEAKAPLYKATSLLYSASKALASEIIAVLIVLRTRSIRL